MYNYIVRIPSVVYLYPDQKIFFSLNPLRSLQRARSLVLADRPSTQGIECSDHIPSAAGFRRKENFSDFIANPAFREATLGGVA